jgi:hypothetical protein
VRVSLDPFKVPGGLTLTRTAAGSYTAGVYVPGAVTTQTLDPVVVYRNTALVTERLAEGQRGAERLTFLTRTEVFGPQDDGAPGDKITYNGVDYLIVDVVRWAENGEYYESIGVRQYGD